MFTFDPSKITDGLMDFGSFMKAISFASTAYLKALLNPFTKGSNAEAARLAYETKFNEVMGGGDSPSSEMQPVLNPSTSALANQNAMLDASGGGVVYYNNSTNTSNASTTQDTYNQSELSSDHKEESGGFFSRVDWTFWN